MNSQGEEGAQELKSSSYLDWAIPISQTAMSGSVRERGDDDACFSLVNMTESRNVGGEMGGGWSGIAGGVSPRALDAVVSGRRSVFIMLGGRDLLSRRVRLDRIDGGVLDGKPVIDCLWAAASLVV